MAAAGNFCLDDERRRTTGKRRVTTGDDDVSSQSVAHCFGNRFPLPTHITSLLETVCVAVPHFSRSIFASFLSPSASRSRPPLDFKEPRLPSSADPVGAAWGYRDLSRAHRQSRGRRPTTT